jgi:hypothetical protein
VEHPLGHEPTQDRVPEELQPFVGLLAGVFTHPRPVGQRDPQQHRIGEPVSDPAGEGLEIGAGAQAAFTRVNT